MTRASQRAFPGGNSRESHWQMDDSSQWRLQPVQGAGGVLPATNRTAETGQREWPSDAMAGAPNHSWESGSELSHATFHYSRPRAPPATLAHSTQSRESSRDRQLPSASSTNNSLPASGVTWNSEVRRSLGLPYNSALPRTTEDAAAAAATSSGIPSSVPQDHLIPSANLHDSSTPIPTWLHDDQWTAEFFAGSSGVDSLHFLPPRRAENQESPSIRLTTATATASSQPQAAHLLSASASPLAGHDNNHTLALPTSLPSRMSPFMATETTETIQAPVSPISPRQSPHDTAMGDQQHQLPRKRSHSVMSQQHDASIADVLRSRAPSTHSQAGASPPEEFSPRGSRAFKRGDPPMNPDGKYICNFSDDCFGQTFERKCEWSKHMDKHDRPYRCPHPSCAKLQGFTYSGGLLRHEREVHGKHGGPKAQLVCPFTDCKRHSGKGFTRKENLNEHLRRVHNGKEATSQQDSMLEQNGNEVASGVLDGETQASAMTATGGEELASLEPSLKRKRSNPPQDHTSLTLDENGMMQEVNRLRTENSWQADRIRQLEAAAAMNAEKTQRLEETMSLWAQQQSQAHVQHEQQQQPAQALMQHHEQEEQQFAQQHEAPQNNEHHQLAEQQIVEHHLADQHMGEEHMGEQSLGDQQLNQHDTVEGDMKAVFAAVQAAEG
ncbi:hypothetical protein BST61_g4442 [Cercospora zeina]